MEHIALTTGRGKERMSMEMEKSPRKKDRKYFAAKRETCRYYETCLKRNSYSEMIRHEGITVSGIYRT